MIYNYLLKMDTIFNERLEEAAIKQTMAWRNAEPGFTRPWRVDYLGTGIIDDNDIFDTANFLISGLNFEISSIYDMKTFVSTIMKSLVGNKLENSTLIQLNNWEVGVVFQRHIEKLGEDSFNIDHKTDSEKKEYFKYLKDMYYNYNLQHLLHKELDERYEKHFEVNEGDTLTSEELQLLNEKERNYEYKALVLGTMALPIRLEGRKAIIGKLPVFLCDKKLILPNYMKIIKNIEIVIDEDAFNGCEQLEEVVISAGTSKIGDRAFMDCINLKEITIHEGVKEIGEYAFLGCINLGKIELPDSIDSLTKDFFLNDVDIICKENSYVHKHAMELGADVTLI